MPHTLRDVVENRTEEFRDNYQFHEHNEAVRALAVAGDLLALMFDEATAQLAMTALRSLISPNRTQGWDWSHLATADIGPNWRQHWATIEGWDDAEIAIGLFFDDLHDLNSFANFGIQTVWSGAGDDTGHAGVEVGEGIRGLKDLPGWVESVCLKIDQLERLAPRNEKGDSTLNEILRTRDRARARIRYDQGHSITVRELALLSNVSTKRLQNSIYAKTDEAPVVEKNGLIRPAACEAWLAARDYRPSVWKQVSALYPLGANWGRDVLFEETEPVRIVDDFIFVPIANDGTMFIPSLRRDGEGHQRGYTIGDKSSEHVVADFEAALAELQKMDSPRWRRPNPESGNWGVVTGQTWKRVRRAELEGLSQ